MILQEQHLIPNKCHDLPPGPWLVFAPHADDETFGLGGSILRAAKEGIQVTVVILTDGSLSSPESDRDEVRLQREAEARVACQTLGIDLIEFWRYPDRGLAFEPHIIDQISNLLVKLDPTSVFAPSPLEYHPDHRVAAALVWYAVEQATEPTRGLYFYDISNLGPCNRLIDISTQVNRKREAMAIYSSQQQAHDYIRFIQALNTVRCYSLPEDVIAAECLWHVNPKDYPSLPTALSMWATRYVVDNKRSTHSPLVSVIIRTKDRLALLRQALRSVINQTYRAIELVVVNDAGISPSDMLTELEHELPDFKLIELNNNQGRAAAANAGLNASSGEYLLFLDDDDWMLPQHISKLVSTLIESKQLVAYTGVALINDEGSAKETLGVMDHAFDRHRLYFENYLPIHAVMFSRSIVDQGIRMDESLEVFEDWDFWLQVTRVVPVFTHVAGVSAMYRVTNNATTVMSNEHGVARKHLYARWAKTLGVNELDDLFTRLHLSHKLK